MKTLISLLLLCACVASATPVYFLSQDWQFGNQLRPFTGTPVFPNITDGTNIFTGLPFTVKFLPGTNRVDMNIVPNRYTLSTAGINATWRIDVPNTNVPQNAVWLTTNLITYTYINNAGYSAATLQGGSNVTISAGVPALLNVTPFITLGSVIIGTNPSPPGIYDSQGGLYVKGNATFVVGGQFNGLIAGANGMTLSGGIYSGDGSGISNIQGSKIVSGTVNSNTFDTGTAAQLSLAGTVVYKAQFIGSASGLGTNVQLRTVGTNGAWLAFHRISTSDLWGSGVDATMLDYQISTNIGGLQFWLPSSYGSTNMDVYLGGIYVTPDHDSFNNTNSGVYDGSGAQWSFDGIRAIVINPGKTWPGALQVGNGNAECLIYFENGNRFYGGFRCPPPISWHMKNDSINDSEDIAPTIWPHWISTNQGAEVIDLVLSPHQHAANYANQTGRNQPYVYTDIATNTRTNLFILRGGPGEEGAYLPYKTHGYQIGGTQFVTTNSDGSAAFGLTTNLVTPDGNNLMTFTAGLLTSIVPLDSNALAFFTWASITDIPTKAAVNQLVLNAKAHGWWNKVECIYPMVGPNISSMLYNLRTNDYILVNHSATWSPTGMVFVTASSAYVDSGFKPASSFNQCSYGINSKSVMTYVEYLNTGVSAYLAGTYDNVSTRDYIEFNNGEGYRYWGSDSNSKNLVFVAPQSYLGSLIFTRTAANSEAYYLSSSATNVTSSATTLGSMNSLNIFFGAQNNGGSPLGYLSGTLAGAMIGAGFTGSDPANIMADWTTFNTAMGRKVP